MVLREYLMYTAKFVEVQYKNSVCGNDQWLEVILQNSFAF